MNLPRLTNRSVRREKFQAITVCVQPEAVHKLDGFRTKPNTVTDVAVAKTVIADGAVNASISNRTDPTIDAFDFRGVSGNLRIGNGSQSAADVGGGPQIQERLSTLDRLRRIQYFVAHASRNFGEPMLRSVIRGAVDVLGLCPKGHIAETGKLVPVLRVGMTGNYQQECDNNDSNSWLHGSKDRKTAIKVQRKEKGKA